MSYSILEMTGQITSKQIDEIVELDKQVFKNERSANKIRTKFNECSQLLTYLVYDGPTLIAFKVGYPESPDLFYSWIGCVSSEYRNKGIASDLIKRQHQKLKELGYKRVTTKSGNEYRAMMALNLKHGFDIIGTNINQHGELRVHFRKVL